VLPSHRPRRSRQSAYGRSPGRGAIAVARYTNVTG
jgi:hypothetical protein